MWAVLAPAAAVLLWVGITWATLPSVGNLASENPKTTALIEARAREAEAQGSKPRLRQRWVQLGAVAPVAVQAVLASEDARFWQHGGVDTVELELALEEAWDKKALGRGASTITQQLAKNLWLGEDRSVLRKLKELVLARRLEEALPKKRILTLYLNVIEWGPGVYGIEAAAREHFGVPAASLTPAQGAILAGMLPAPRRWLPSRKPPVLRRRALRIVDRLAAAGRLTAGQAAAARAQVEAILGHGAPAAGPGVAAADEVEEDAREREEAAAAEEAAPRADGEAAAAEARSHAPPGAAEANVGEASDAALPHVPKDAAAVPPEDAGGRDGAAGDAAQAGSDGAATTADAPAAAGERP